MRLLMAADPAAADLIRIARSRKTKPGDRITAIREILNRAGVSTAQPVPDAAAASGQVLWEEFIQIHRLRVGEEKPA